MYKLHIDVQEEVEDVVGGTKPRGAEQGAGQDGGVTSCISIKTYHTPQLCFLFL